MPIYEYACDTCGTFEVTQRITDKALRRCPTCKRPVRKLISSTSFQLKGSGWYVTDYAGKKRSDDGKPAPSKDSASKEASSSKDSSPSKDSSKSESKSEPKTESKKTETKGEASAA